MERFLPLIYDLMAVVIILVGIARGALRGFTATVVSLVGHLAAFLGALLLSKAGGQMIYQTVVRRHVLEFINQQITASPELGELLEQIGQMVQQMPRAAANILGLAGLDENQLAQTIGQTVSGAAAALEENIVGPAVVGFLAAALFVVLFAVFSFVARRLTSAAQWVCSIPGLQTMDRFLGGTLGLVQAGINLYLICIVVRLVLTFVAAPMEYLNLGIIQQTVIWSRVYYFDPFAFLAALG